MNTHVLRFTASWCQPCKALAAQIDQIKPGVPIDVVDVDSQKDLVAEYGVRSVPTLIKIRDDQEIDRCTGPQSLEKLEEFLK